MATPTRFYLLDALRGLAALSVVVFHYQNFFFTAPKVLPADFEPLSQPFSDVLGVFYLYGNSAVQLFFVLSGTVFFHVYAQSLAGGKTSGYQFFVMRFSMSEPVMSPARRPSGRRSSNWPRPRTSADNDHVAVPLVDTKSPHPGTAGSADR